MQTVSVSISTALSKLKVQTETIFFFKHEKEIN